MIRTTTAVVALCAAPAFASQTASYSWEDGGTIFGYFNSGSGEIIATNSSAQANSGSSSLEIVESPTGGTPQVWICLLYTSPSPRDGLLSRMPSSA